jgi:hypothetical protein
MDPTDYCQLSTYQTDQIRPNFHTDIFITQETVIIHPVFGCQGLDHEKRSELRECEDGTY